MHRLETPCLLYRHMTSIQGFTPTTIAENKSNGRRIVSVNAVRVEGSLYLPSLLLVAFPSFLNASHECDQRPKCRRPTGCPQSVWSAHPPQAATISCCRFPSRTWVLDLPIAVGCCDISRFPSPICKEASNCGLRSEEGRGGGV